MRINRNLMITKQIPLNEIRFFSSLINDYILDENKLRTLYNHFPDISNFKKQIEEKQKHFKTKKRIELTKAIKEQYKGFEISEKVSKNIELLSNNNTFTITTGHQLSLFTGHLYFIYKIISAINTAKILSEYYPAFEFVPVR